MSTNNTKYYIAFFLLILLFATHSPCHSQAYLGYIKKETALLDSNLTEIEKIKKGEAVFIHAIPEKSTHLLVNHINTNKEGLVSSKSIYLLEEVIENTATAFSSIKQSDKKDPIIKIHNSTNDAIKLRIDNKNYIIAAKERLSISLKKGKYIYAVTSANMLPHYGKENLDEFRLYEWEFYID